MTPPTTVHALAETVPSIVSSGVTNDSVPSLMMTTSVAGTPTPSRGRPSTVPEIVSPSKKDQLNSRAETCAGTSRLSPSSTGSTTTATLRITPCSTLAIRASETPWDDLVKTLQLEQGSGHAAGPG